MSRVAVLFAMASEAAPFLATVEATAESVDDGVPTRWHRARVAHHDVVVSINGRDRLHGVELIGTQPATLATYLSVTRFRPECSSAPEPPAVKRRTAAPSGRST